MMEFLVKMNRNLRITIFIILIFASFSLLIGTGNLIFAPLFFIFLGLLISSNVSHSRYHLEILGNSLEKALSKNNFKADDHYLSNDFLNGIALNNKDNVIAFFERKSIDDEFIPKYYNYQDILECAIQEDGNTITHTSNSSIVKRALVGGVLFGGVGAAIGAISAKHITIQKINKATLTVVINDMDNPIYEINFINSNNIVDKSSEFYKRKHAELDNWHKTISVIIKRNELNSKTV